MLLLSILLACMLVVVQAKETSNTLNANKAKMLFTETENYLQQKKKIENGLYVFMANGVQGVGEILASFLGDDEPELKRINDATFLAKVKVWDTVIDSWVKVVMTESRLLFEALYQLFGTTWIDELDGMAKKLAMKRALHSNVNLKRKLNFPGSNPLPPFA
uniref:Uncharacterized protein n=1 Tax=Schistocephalus solidus TaxID=70667 RepID=A0A0X3NTM4_SCHSO